MKRLLALAVALAASAAPAQPAKPACAAACLADLANRYVAALAQRGASASLPWAARVRYSENGVPMMVDDGIWATVTAYGAHPLVIADPAAATVTWMGEIEEHGQPAFLALRLKAAGRSLAEAEAVIRRKEGRPPFADPAAFDFTAGMVALPPTQRLPRSRLAAVAEAYVAAGAASQLAPDCVRIENGVTSDGGCAVAGTEAVRGGVVKAVDAERGIATVAGVRDYSGVGTAGGPPADAPYPHSYAFAAVLGVRNGKVVRVEEISSAVPYRMPAWGDRK